jgi:hypothetical protein
MDEHLGDTALAIDDLQTAAALTPDAAQRPSLSLRITALQSRLDLQQQNAARRPIIQSKSPAQSALVRPRLTAATAKETP